MPAIIPLLVGPTSLDTSHSRTSTFSHHHILHVLLVAGATDGLPEAVPGQEYQIDRDRQYDDVSSCRRAYEPKGCGGNGCRGLRFLENVTSRGVVWYFRSCNQNVQGDTSSCPFTASTFRPGRDSAKKTKIICVACVLPVNRAISIGKKLEGN